MKQQCEILSGLIASLPASNSYRSSSELNSILSKYTRVLDYVNGFNDSFKSATRVFYSDITNIRDNIESSLYASTQQDKDNAFESAKNELRSDLDALSTLIMPHEEFAG